MKLSRPVHGAVRCFGHKWAYRLRYGAIGRSRRYIASPAPANDNAFAADDLHRYELLLEGHARFDGVMWPLRPWKPPAPARAAWRR